MLPYTDTKPVGAADFYFGINATFRFIRKKFGDEGLTAYWTDIGRQYFAPVTKIWKEGGLAAVAEYWRDFFAAEPGSNVEVAQNETEVVVTVHECPAIRHLRANNREIEPWFCRHCYYVSAAIAEPAGLDVRIEGGNGSCRQRFFKKSANTPPQDLSLITSCA